MAYEVLIKRKLYQFKCDTCKYTMEFTNNPPREILCPNCRIWLPQNILEWTGKDKYDGD